MTKELEFSVCCPTLLVFIKEEQQRQIVTHFYLQPRRTRGHQPTDTSGLQGFTVFLSSSAGTKRVHNNIVYNEYISNREHVHMNSTQWETLTDFTKWLGREGNRPDTIKVFMSVPLFQHLPGSE